LPISGIDPRPKIVKADAAIASAINGLGIYAKVTQVVGSPNAHGAMGHNLQISAKATSKRRKPILFERFTDITASAIDSENLCRSIALEPKLKSQITEAATTNWQ
jgi:hypothetical protein